MQATETETIAELYHRLTSYAADRHWLEPVDDDRLELDFMPLSPHDEPPAFKEYPAGLPRVPLPVAAAAADVSAVAALGGRPRCQDNPPDLDSVAAILFQCAGVTRYSERADGTRGYFRAASSAGNRHPLEVYLCARQIRGLADGVWHYAPRSHALTQVGPPPQGDAPALVITGVPWRSCWKYAERGYRYTGWDCGTLAAQAVLAAWSRRLNARLETAFTDRELSSLTGARDPDEIPLAVIPLMPGAPAVTPAAAAERGYLGADVRRFRLVTAIHDAGNLAGAGEVASWRGRPDGAGPASLVPPPAVPVPGTATDEPFDALSRRRGSARKFDASAQVAADAMAWLAGLSAAPLPWDGGVCPDVHVIAHRVAGMAAGVYRRAGAGWVPARPADRKSSYMLCLGQELGRDAAFLVFFTPAPGPGVARDARGYRAAMIAAGFGLGRLYAAATALGLGCSGLTFTDSLLPATLGRPAALAAAAVGRTPYRQRPGGVPASLSALGAAGT